MFKLQKGRVSTSQAAKLLGVSVTTIRNRVRSGQLRAEADEAGHLWFDRGQFDGLVDTPQAERPGTRVVPMTVDMIRVVAWVQDGTLRHVLSPVLGLVQVGDEFDYLVTDEYNVPVIYGERHRSEGVETVVVTRERWRQRKHGILAEMADDLTIKGGKRPTMPAAIKVPLGTLLDRFESHYPGGVPENDYFPGLWKVTLGDGRVVVCVTDDYQDLPCPGRLREVAGYEPVMKVELASRNDVTELDGFGLDLRS